MAQSASPIVTRDPAHVAERRIVSEPHEVTADLFVHSAFVNTYAVKTSAGLLMVDPGLAGVSKRVYDAVRGWSRDPLHTAVYTHGHVDHAFGLRAFLEAGERPQIVAQENVLRRFARYRMTHGLNARINQRQFSLPVPVFPETFDPPTLTYRDSLTQQIGDTRVEYRAAKGETDDHSFIFLPERGYLFTGDLIIWQAPNCGNPQKVQRYPLEWAEALEAMVALEPEWVFPGHGLIVQGREAARKLLSETARYLRVIVDQVLARMNAGQSPEQIFHEVEPDPELAGRPYLQPHYDHPKFIVRNLLRLYGGWWNGNAADLLPATWADQAAEIARLAGGTGPIVERARKLLESGQTALASHLAEWATRAEPQSSEAQALKREVYERRMSQEDSLMGRGIFRAAANEARSVLGVEPITPRRMPRGSSIA